MDNEYIKIIQQVKDGFQKNKGKGYCYIYETIDPIPIIVDIVISLINRNAERKILIALEEYKFKAQYKQYIIDNDLNEELYYKNIQFLSHSYLLGNNKERDVFISLGINDDANALLKNFHLHKFSLIIFTKSIMNNAFINEINSEVNQIPVKLDNEKLLYKKIYSPVKEYRHYVILNEDDRELYNKYDKYIKDSISIFGSLQQIERCRIGNFETHTSAIDECYKVAYNNGWSSELDMSLEYNQQLDELFNPNAIRERVNTIFNITNSRKKLVADNDAKLEVIKNIIDANQNKKILIISLRGDFCNRITKYLNEECDKNYMALGYHNELEDSYLTGKDGKVVVWKSGKQKGEPRIFKADFLSSNNEAAFKEGYTNILCIKSSSKNTLTIDVDVVIFTSTLIDDIFKIKRRFDNIKFKEPTIIHRIYCKDTNEEKTILNEKPSNLVEVCESDIEKNLFYDENSGDIVL